MRALALLAISTACGGHAPAGAAPADLAGAGPLPALRWVPAHPTYVLAAAHLRDAQRAVVDVLDELGVLVDSDARAASGVLQELLRVDPLAAGAVAAIGVDPDGGAAVFSEDLDPTLVVHLASPDALAAFFDRQRTAGLHTSSLQIDGIEVYRAHLAAHLEISWAIDHDWLWVHFALTGTSDPSWFADSHRPERGSWQDAWQRAVGPETRGLLGFVDVRAMLVRHAMTRGALACAQLVAPIDGVAIALAFDPHHPAARLTVEVPSVTAAIGQALLPPPPGWVAVASGAAVAVEADIDLGRVRAAIQPCTDALGLDLGPDLGVRAGRAALLALDPDAGWGSGVVAAELRPHARAGAQLAALLDRIPLRAQLERDHSWGALHGHHLAIPFKGSIDYVLDDAHLWLAVGDGVLDKLAAPGPAAAPRLLALDLRPPALADAAWRLLLEELEVRHRSRIVEHLAGWRDVHLSVVLSGRSLVLDVSGNRR